MGAISFSIDENLIKELRKFLPLEIFIETGTFLGDSLEAASRCFETCYSVELSAEYHHAASARFAHDPRIHIYHEDSSKFLEQNHSLYEGKSVLFWLDAHRCVADDTAGGIPQCPLLEELTAIARINSQSVIIIDDARLFLAPPTAPHEASQWPCFEDVNQALHKLSDDHVLTIFNDTMIFYPRNIQEHIKTFFVRTGVDWLSVLDKSRSYDDLLVQLQSKELEIRVLSDACDERLFHLNAKEGVLLKKEAEILALSKECDTRLQDLKAKDREIRKLLAVCDKGLKLVERLSGISTRRC